MNGAVHAEYGAPGAPIISALSCSLVGKEITVELTPDSLLHRLHNQGTVVELTTCNYGLNPDWQHIAGERGMTVAATDDTGEVRAVERPEHPFFVATLYQPQLSSSASRPHPIFLAFVQAALLYSRTNAGRGAG